MFASTRATASESKPGLEVYFGRISWTFAVSNRFGMLNLFNIFLRSMLSDYRDCVVRPTRRFDLSVSQSGPCCSYGPSGTYVYIYICMYNIVFSTSWLTSFVQVSKPTKAPVEIMLTYD